MVSQFVLCLPVPDRIDNPEYLLICAFLHLVVDNFGYVPTHVTLLGVTKNITLSVI